MTVRQFHAAALNRYYRLNGVRLLTPREHKSFGAWWHWQVR
jgi:hypothetical protein